MLSPTALLTLARVYAEAEGLTLTTVGRRSCKNNKVFVRLAEGKGASSRTLEAIEDFFRHQWPQTVPWPAGVPKLPKRGKPNQKGPKAEAAAV